MQRAGLAALVVATAALGCDDPRARDQAARGRYRAPVRDAAPPPRVGPAPKLLVTPTAQTWGPVAVGTSWFHVISFANLGDQTLRFERLLRTGDPAFSPRVGGLPLDENPWLSEDPDGDGAPGLSPGARFDVDVFFRPRDGGPHQATLVAVTDDPAQPRVEVALDGEGAPPPPCDPIGPASLSFEPTPVGLTRRDQVTVRNCGTTPLHIESVRFDSAAFRVPDAFPLDLPQRLRAPQTAIDRPGYAFPLEFAPSGLGSHFARLEVRTDDPAAPVRVVELLGEGAENRCPRAVSDRARLTAALGEAVRVDGAASTDPEDQRLIHQWRVVERPPGSRTNAQDRLAADGRETGERPETSWAVFVPDRVGRYTLELDVTDPLGNRSSDCGQAARVVVDVRPPAEGFVVVLDWESPDDPDDDRVGNDLDLHLAHPRAGDRWFEPLYDCFPGAPTPDWGEPLVTEDDPEVTVSGLDGRGPEIIRLARPERTGEGPHYRLGVHFFRRAVEGADFGPARPRLRVFAEGEEVWSSAELPPREMEQINHFWEVAEVAWRADGVRVRPIDRYLRRRP